jgi:hypothetical protein
MEGRRVADGARSVVAFLVPFASYVNDLRFRLQLPPPRPTAPVLMTTSCRSSGISHTRPLLENSAAQSSKQSRESRQADGNGPRPIHHRTDDHERATALLSTYLLLAKAR